MDGDRTRRLRDAVLGMQSKPVSGSFPRPAVWIALCLAWPATAAGQEAVPLQDRPEFATAEQCIACHSNLRDETGADVSIGHAWRATMMAHAARDPYWQAAVQRGVMDQPQLQPVIEDTCSTCHMPMARTAARAAGGLGRIFAHLEASSGDPTGQSVLAMDGVSCTVCHQLLPDDFGEHASFDGGCRIGGPEGEDVAVFGPFDDVDDGRRRIMQSASGFSPTAGPHVQESELCATCHTLFTTARDANGREVGRLPEQVPYLEWRHSGYRGERSCQDCHMPEAAPAPIASVLGEPREGLSRHAFRGGNAFMLRLLAAYRDELRVSVPAEELEASAALTAEHLRNDTARIARLDVRFDDAALVIDVEARNLAGHKLPTADPSRRAWLHLRVRNQDGATLFESGAMQADGSIMGNDSDVEPLAFEPHYREIVAPDQVQIYESVIVDHRDAVTTPLLRGVRYVKDNRLLPAGFDKASADADIAVHGNPADDVDFLAEGDAVRYRVTVAREVETVTVSVHLMFQSIGYRWARNLTAYDAFETNRFVRYYEASAADSAVVLATAESQHRRH